MISAWARWCKASANLMVTSIHIRNFRSFNDVKIDDCRRINIIVGDNGSGKTALLEALFLAAGISPELALRTRTWRGYEGGQMSGTHEAVEEALWADLFYRFDTSRPAFISLKGVHTRSVTVRLNLEGNIKLIPPSRKKSGAPVTVVRERSTIEFNWNIHGYGEVRIAPRFEGDSLVIDPPPRQHVRASFFAANRVLPSLEVANRFSELSRHFKADEFIQSYHSLYEKIQSLSVEVDTGAPMLFAAVNGLPRKIPITLASGGMSKLAAILLAFPEQSGGLILVDEIENGFYYQRLPLVWQALFDFAREYDCQVFASTHSDECLGAAAELAEKHPDDFSVIRTVLEDDGTKVRHFGGNKFVAAREEHIDIR
jgi:hypothetical protein